VADNRYMRIRFTKMQGAGNDFVVLDETTKRLNLTPAHYRFLADRHFGVGADQVLTVRPAPQADVDFEYLIHNADGGEVEQCGNGSRCFVRFVREQGLTDKTTVRVKVHGGIITLQEMPDGQVTVDMGAPVFDLAQVPFASVHASAVNDASWQLALSNGDHVQVGVVESRRLSHVVSENASTGSVACAVIAGAVPAAACAAAAQSVPARIKPSRPLIASKTIFSGSVLEIKHW
jgi:diaminopimelate epimerase